MKLSHKNFLEDLMDTIANNGLATAPKWKLAKIYGYTNFTVTVRRSLKEAWQEKLAELGWKEKENELAIGETVGEIALINTSIFFDE